MLRLEYGNGRGPEIENSQLIAAHNAWRFSETLPAHSTGRKSWSMGSHLRIVAGRDVTHTHSRHHHHDRHASGSFDEGNEALVAREQPGLAGNAAASHWE